MSCQLDLRVKLLVSRHDRGIKSLEGLKKRVKQCSLAAESKWVDDEISTVVDYLNKKFYKF